MEWGGVAEWVGAVGTIGALLLGISLFARDRAFARRAGVDALNTWLSWEDVTDGDEGFRRLTVVHVCNSGTRPVYAPLLFYPDRRGGYGSEIISDDGRPAMLPPGAEMSRVIQGMPRNTIARSVLLRSDDGRLWIRKVDEHRYANTFVHIVLLLLLLCFERQDGASPRRLRQRERRVADGSSARLAPSGSPGYEERQR